MTNILTTSTSPKVDNTSAYGILSWTESPLEGERSSILDWKLTVYTTPSTNYRTIRSLTNAINIGPFSYAINYNTKAYNKTVVASGKTTIVHDENGEKTISVSVRMNVGGDYVSGSTSVRLMTVDSTPAQPLDYKYMNGSNIPVLFSPNATDFETNGIGLLTGCSKCTVEEELNGSYELEISISTDSLFFSQIKNGSLIACKPNRIARRQAFEVYEIEKTINGTATIKARHISYRLLYVPINPYKSSSTGIKVKGPANAFNALKNAAVESYSPFTFTTDVTSDKEFIMAKPGSMRSAFGEDDGCFLSAFEGEWEWDNFNVKFLQNRGKDYGVVLRYAKNLTDLEAIENAEDVTTGYLPFYVNSKSHVVGSIQYNDHKDDYAYHRTQAADLTSYFDTTPTATQLNNKMKELIKEAENDENLKTTLTVSYVDLSRTIEYKDFEKFENVSLGDTVHVVYQGLGVSYKAEVKKVRFDALQDMIEEIEIGDPENTFIQTYVSAQTEIERLEEKRKQQEEATDYIRDKTEENTRLIESTIVSDVIHYLATTLSEGVTKDTSGWTDAIQLISEEKRYLWVYHTLTYGDQTVEDTDPLIIGVYGQKGADGEDAKNIKSVSDQYYVSTSNIEPTGGQWLENYDEALRKAKEYAESETKTPFYIWDRSVTIFDDNTYHYGDPRINSSLTTTVTNQALLEYDQTQFKSTVSNTYETKVDAAETKTIVEEHQTWIDQNGERIELAASSIEQLEESMTVQETHLIVNPDGVYVTQSGNVDNSTKFTDHGMEVYSGGEVIAEATSDTFKAPSFTTTSWTMREEDDGKVFNIFRGEL